MNKRRQNHGADVPVQHMQQENLTSTSRNMPLRDCVCMRGREREFKGLHACVGERYKILTRRVL